MKREDYLQASVLVLQTAAVENERHGETGVWAYLRDLARQIKEKAEAMQESPQ